MGATIQKGGARPPRPAHRTLHRRHLHVAGRCRRHQLVKRHDDIRIEQPLNLGRAFRGDQMARAVQMRFERHPLFRPAGQIGQAHHLIAATVSQDRPVPAHETVQPAQPGDALGPRAQHQVIGVAKDDVGTRRAHIAGLHRLHGGGGADRHEGGGANVAALHGDHAGARAAVGRGDLEGETLGHGRKPLAGRAALC